MTFKQKFKARALVDKDQNRLIFSENGLILSTSQKAKLEMVTVGEI
jgi:hypothetical protein